jgi:hypothetical protein
VTRLSALVLLACLGCSPTPERIFKKMQSAACNGDVPGFFRYVNKTALLESITKDTEQRMASDGKPTAMVDAIGPGVFAEEMTGWEDDVKRSKDGDWCRAKFVSADNDGGRVAWSTPTGKPKLGLFEKSGDTFLLVGLQ